MNNKQRKIAWVVVVVMMILLCWYLGWVPADHEGTKRPFSITMSQTGMIGWHNGHKQWQISAETVATSADQVETLFNNITAGILFDQDIAKAWFQSPEAYYEHRSGNLSFPQGLTITLGSGVMISVASAQYDNQNHILAVQGVSIRGTDAELTGDQGVLTHAASQVTIDGTVRLSTLDFVTQCNQVNYQTDTGQLILSGLVVINSVGNGEMPMVTSTAAGYDFMSGQLCLTGPCRIRLLSGWADCDQAVCQINTKHWRLNGNVRASLTDTGQGSCTLTADSLDFDAATGVVVIPQHVDVQMDACTLSADKLEWSQQLTVAGPQLCLTADDRPMQLRAEQLTGPVSGPWTLNGAVQIERDDGRLYGELAVVTAQQSLTLRHGGADWQDGSHYQLTAERLEYGTDASLHAMGTVQLDDGGGHWTADNFYYQHARHRGSFSGSVVFLDHLGNRLQTEQVDWNGQNRRFQAQRHVTIHDPDGNAVECDQVVGDDLADTLLCSGGLQLIQSDGTVVHGNQLVYDRKQHDLLLTGSVVANQPDGRWLRSDTMTYDCRNHYASFDGNVQSGGAE